MGFISVKEASEKWGITERVVRQYCADGRVPGAFITGKTWNIPDNADKPGRKPRQRPIPEDLLGRLVLEKDNGISGGIYHKVQIELTYNSNHMEGSRLTHEQTRYIFETNTIDAPDGSLNVDDILETVNHFRCIDMMIDQANRPLTETMIAPKDVPKMMKELLSDYQKHETVTFDDPLDFHYCFESIHPFQDGNGRVGRLIFFKECLRNGIVPFIIEDDMKMYYYRGLQEWRSEKGYLRDTCLAAQDRFKAYLDYYGIKY